jgi:hypothetical protein
LPALGSASRALRVVNETWNSRTELVLDLSGLAGHEYGLGVWNPAQISNVQNAILTKSGKLQFKIPPGPEETYLHQKVIIHFAQ